MKPKRIVFLTIFICLFTFSGTSLAKKAFPMTQKKLELYEDLYKKIESQFEALEKFTDKKLLRGGHVANKRTWDKFARNWEANNFGVKFKAKQFQEVDGIVFEHFEMALRDLTILGYEYRRFFYLEEGNLSVIKKQKEIFANSMKELRSELDHLNERTAIFIDALTH